VLAGLERLAELERSGRLNNYHLLPAAQARLFGKLGRWRDAAERYRQAIILARNAPEQRFLAVQLAHAETLVAEG